MKKLSVAEHLHLGIDIWFECNYLKMKKKTRLSKSLLNITSGDCYLFLIMFKGVIKLLKWKMNDLFLEASNSIQHLKRH